MATAPALLAVLREKTGVSNRRLNQRANELRRELPMSSEMAYLVLAHREGIDIRPFVTNVQEAEVRNVVAQLRSMPSQAYAPARTNGRARAKAPAKQTVVTIAGVNVEKIPGLSTAHAKEAKAMARGCTRFYVFENSVRDVIAGTFRRAWFRLVEHRPQKESEIAPPTTKRRRRTTHGTAAEGRETSTTSTSRTCG